jgi:hypothetical protein
MATVKLPPNCPPGKERVNLEEPVRVASPHRINLEEPISSGYPAQPGLIRFSVCLSVRAKRVE